MARRFSTLTFIPLAFLAACSSGPGAPPPDEASAAEEQLTSRADALQKTLYEAAAVGGGVGFGIGFGIGGTRGGSTGLSIGLPLGLAAGGYVASIQRDYDDEEEQLEQIAADLDRTNAEAEAALITMRQVLAEQRAQIAALRAGIQDNAILEEALEQELDDIRENVKQMERAIEGAEMRESDFGDARDIVPGPSATEQIDPRVQALSRRIMAMREIADSLSQEIG